MSSSQSPLHQQRSGDSFGNISIGENSSASIHQGDVVINNNFFSPRRDEVSLSEGSDVLAVLRYDKMNVKRDYAMPEETFRHDWIWETSFDEWLGKSSGTFSISGKPGSGKSTLMAYLAHNQRTIDGLCKQDVKFKILHFFYDYKSGTGLANTVEGMLRAFLFQLAQDFEQVRLFIHKSLVDGNLSLTSRQSLMNVTCAALTLPDARFCVFIDGLDEYEGNHAQLMQLCNQMIDRTGLKMCLACRPEIDVGKFTTVFAVLTMQEHNRSSMNAYMTQRLLLVEADDSGSAVRIDETIQEELLSRAEGVILWFKLAADETIKKCQLGTSQDELYSFIETLPTGLSPMYRRVLSLIPSQHREEAALLLYLIREMRAFTRGFEDDHTQDLDHLWGYYICLQEDLAPQISLPIYKDYAYTEQRIRSLLRGLVETTKLEDTGRDFCLGPSLIDVRLIHKSFHNFLQTDTWIDRNLNSEFTRLVPDSLMLKLSTIIISDAAFVERCFTWSMIEALCDEYVHGINVTETLEYGNTAQTFKGVFKGVRHVWGQSGAVIISMLNELYPRIQSWHAENDPEVRDDPDASIARTFLKGFSRTISKGTMLMSAPKQQFHLSPKWKARREVLRRAPDIFLLSLKQYDAEHAKIPASAQMLIEADIGTILMVSSADDTSIDNPLSIYLARDVLMSKDLRAISDLIMSLVLPLSNYLDQKIAQIHLTSAQLTFLMLVSVVHYARGFGNLTACLDQVDLFVSRGGRIEGTHICGMLRMGNSVAAISQLSKKFLAIQNSTNQQIDPSKHYSHCENAGHKRGLLLDWIRWRQVKRRRLRQWQSPEKPYIDERDVEKHYETHKSILELILSTGFHVDDECSSLGTTMQTLLGEVELDKRLLTYDLKCKFMALVESGANPQTSRSGKKPLRIAQHLLQKVKKKSDLHLERRDFEFIVSCLEYYDQQLQWPERTWAGFQGHFER